MAEQNKNLLECSERHYLDQLRVRCHLPPAANPLDYLRDCWGEGSYEYLFLAQLNTDFLLLMTNRLILGGLRYGAHFKKGKKKYDRIGSIQKRLDAYQATGNMEHLVDIANECLCEFTQPSLLIAHWDPQDDPGLHTEEL